MGQNQIFFYVIIGGNSAGLVKYFKTGASVEAQTKDYQSLKKTLGKYNLQLEI